MTTRKKREAAVVQPEPIIVEFLLDETGSMTKIKPQTISGFNAFIDEQKMQDGVCLLTLTKFDTSGQRTPYLDLDVGAAPHLTAETFLPGDATNLRDTIIGRIDNLKQRLSKWDIVPRVLFVCMTDGADNASSATATEVRQVVTAVTEAGWTMVYFGAHGRAKQEAELLGFPVSNVRSFEGADMDAEMRGLSAATTTLRSSAAVSTNCFFS